VVVAPDTTCLFAALNVFTGAGDRTMLGTDI